MRLTGRTKVLGVAAGGHSRVMIEALELGNQAEVVGLVDVHKELWGTMVAGVPVVGGDELLPEMLSRGIKHAFIGLGSSHDVDPRKRLFMKVRSLGFEIIPVIDPRAIISRSAKIGYAPTVLAGAVINTGAQVGDNVIVNTGAIIEHDCILGNHVHVATGARLASAVVIGEEVHIGVGAVVRQCIHIQQKSVVGAGAVVVKDVPSRVVVVGVPARVLRHLER